MRDNPDTTTWLLILGGLGVVGFLGYRYLISRAGRSIGRGLAETLIGGGSAAPGSRRPPPPPSATEREEMERRYRYRTVRGRCFDYKDRKFVDATYCR